jgi:2-polyprenyl-6-methoxyphenol hydroxylase-like FAD-dependent oxidoreductase
MELAERESVQRQRVLVVGGGIAGVATARALLQQGIEADLVERAAGWSQPGTGMYLPANSVRALATLGLEAALHDRAYEVKHQLFLDQRGRALLDVDLPAVWGAIGPCVAIDHRALHELLREGVAVRLGMTITALDDHGAGVRATFADASTGDYDIVVGADGVHSWVRSAIFGGADARFVGQASWRFLVDGFPEISQWTASLGRGKAFLMLPLGAGQIYCYADLSAARPVDPIGSDPTKLVELYSDFGQPVARILEKPLTSGERPYFSPIEEVVHQPWVRGRVVLVGMRRTRCHRTWRRARGWRWRMRSFSPRRSREVGRSRSSKRDGGRASRSSRRRRTGATARVTCRRSSARRLFGSRASGSTARTTNPCSARRRPICALETPATAALRSRALFGASARTPRKLLQCRTKRTSRHSAESVSPRRASVSDDLLQNSEHSRREDELTAKATACDESRRATEYAVCR